MDPLFGYSPNRSETEKFVSSLKYPTFTDGHGAATFDQSKPALLYKALIAVAPWWKRGNQPIGSCVGWGFSLATEILSAVEVFSKGEPETWPGRVLEAATYGFSRVQARGITNAGYSDGSYGGAAAKALLDWGTLHYDRDYAGKTFVKNSGALEKEWGATGVPKSLVPFAKEHRIKTASLVRTADEAFAALVNGFPIGICSNQGFSYTRDKQGFAKPEGHWSHCMMLAAARFDRPGFLVVNSWGPYLKDAGPHWPDDMPKEVADASFWADASVVEKNILSGEDSFAISGYDGFPSRKLENLGFTNDF